MELLKRRESNEKKNKQAAAQSNSFFSSTHSLRMDGLIEKELNLKGFAAASQTKQMKFIEFVWMVWRCKGWLMVDWLIHWVVGYGRLAAMALREKEANINSINQAEWKEN